MWICPECNRPFGSKNQSHSCVKINAADLLKHKPVQLVKAYHKLEKQLGKLEGSMITAAKSALFFKAPSTFCAVKFRKTYMEVEFFLDKKTDVFPVSKTLQLSARRIVHVVPVQDAKEVNAQLIGWIKESYSLVKK